MFDKLRDVAGSAYGRAKVWNRERKERAEEKRAANQDPPSVTVPAWLVRAAHFASWGAMGSLVYFLWLYTLEIARDRAASMHITHAGTWVGELLFWFPYVIGFAIVSFFIPYTAKIAVPTFMSLSWRGAAWPKAWALLIATAVSAVVIFGTFAIQGDTLLERDRESAVAVEGVQQGRAAIEAQIAGITDDLRASTEGNSTQAQAARVGMLAGSVEAARAQWQGSYVRPAEQAGDANTERIRRATGSAEAAAAAVARREALRRQLAESPTVASVQSEVVTERTSWIADTIAWVEGVRAILLSLVMDIVALMMPWIALRLEQARNRQIGMVEGIPRHSYMLTDQHETTKANRDPLRRSAQDVVDAMIAGGADPRFAADMARSAARADVAKEELYDAETGEKLVYRKSTWAKPPKKRERTTVAMPPGEAMPEEAPGDGGRNHAPGVTIGGLFDPASVAPLDAGDVASGVSSGDDVPGASEPPAFAVADDLPVASGDAVTPGEQRVGFAPIGGGIGDQIAPPTDAERRQDDQQNDLEHAEPPSDEIDYEALVLADEPPVLTPDQNEQQHDSAEPDQQSEHVELPDSEGVVVIEDERDEPETRTNRLLEAAK
jgi:low affinity Fe/Cu permease